jgi:hypothetical protein
MPLHQSRERGLIVFVDEPKEQLTISLVGVRALGDQLAQVAQDTSKLQMGHKSGSSAAFPIPKATGRPVVSDLSKKMRTATFDHGLKRPD